MPLSLVPASAYTDLELQGTLRALGLWWQMLGAGIDAAPVEPLRQEQQELLGGDIDRTATALQGRFAAGQAPRDEVERIVDASLALLQNAGRTLAAAQAFKPATGTVSGIFRSGGGVPKHLVDEVTVDRRGVVGDRQRSKRHHGRPWQALCLWSAEVVARLRAEGHPIRPGAAGENLSVAGIDWTLIRPGTRLRLGDEVVAETSAYALPCAKNAQWFVDGDFERMHHDREPGVSRIYASVLQGGTLRTGDPVVLEP